MIVVVHLTVYQEKDTVYLIINIHCCIVKYSFYIILARYGYYDQNYGYSQSPPPPPPPQQAYVQAADVMMMAAMVLMMMSM